jgi:hypothetical protein
MEEKLEEKTLALRENENFTADLVNLMKKFQSQINFSEELLKIKRKTDNDKLKHESLRKLSPVLNKSRPKK